ncbi:hypothetical protein CFB48_17755 [Burkholderia sp. AU33647]|nr:hypothetical protein CFB48_17755 [Burkholderia sp. AU33647]
MARVEDGCKGAAAVSAARHARRAGTKNEGDVKQARRRAEPVPDVERATMRPISSGAPQANQ